MKYDHWKDVPQVLWPYENFAPGEISCGGGDCEFCGGSVIVHHGAMARLQATRDILGAGLLINSGFRCEGRNSLVGGVTSSRHLLGQAFDISLAGHDPATILAAVTAQAWDGRGFYRTFLHVDLRPRRAQWMSKGGRAFWSPYFKGDVL